MAAAAVTHDKVRIEGAVSTCPYAHVVGDNLIFTWDYYRPKVASGSASRVTVNLSPKTGRGAVAVLFAHPDGGDTQTVELEEFEEGADLDRVLDIAKEFMDRLNAHPCREDELNEAWAYLFDRGYEVEFDPGIDGNHLSKEVGEHLSAVIQGVLHPGARARPDIVSIDDECEAGLYDHRDGSWTSVNCRNVEEAAFIIEHGLLATPNGEIVHYDIEAILPSGPKH